MLGLGCHIKTQMMHQYGFNVPWQLFWTFLVSHERRHARPYAKQCLGLDATSPGAKESSGFWKTPFWTAQIGPLDRTKADLETALPPLFLALYIRSILRNGALHWTLVSESFGNILENVFNGATDASHFENYQKIPSFAFYVEHSREAAVSIYRSWDPTQMANQS